MPVLPDEAIKALLKACGKDMPAGRDTAIIRLFLAPGGLRLSELTGLTLDDLDLDNHVVLVLGSGRRPRAVPFGAKTGSALTRYLRVRPAAATTALWLGPQATAMTTSGVGQMLKRRARQAGLGHIHPHQHRHTGASRQ